MKPGHPVTPRPIITATELAQYLRLHVTTIYRLVRQGQIPTFKIGADYRFHRDEIEKWIGDQQVLQGKPGKRNPPARAAQLFPDRSA
jgi:excisionase family DNA binding protein